MQLGDRFGDWTVLSFVGTKGKGNNAYWLCRCVCGNESEICGSKLRNGTTTKCNRCSGKSNGKKGLYKKSEGKHLYVIQSGQYIKIGSSNNPLRRIKDIMSDNPHDVEVIEIVLDKGCLEETLHRKFNKYLHRGEWFKMGIDQFRKET